MWRRQRPPVGPDNKSRLARFRSPSGRDVALSLVGLVVFSTALRIALVARVHAPVVFSDEIGYEKLAQSIGKTGHLGLFNQRGFSYSPLYSAVLAPIYALGASAPTAYSLIKIVNALLISLAVFPTYKIARFALPRGASLLVAAVSVLAPVMFYSSFTMSENLAYPLGLAAIWAMLEAVRAPGPRNDAILLGAIVLASATRVQFVVLVPAALTAIVLAAVLGPDEGVGVGRSLVRTARRHWLVLGVLAGVFLLAVGKALAGQGILSAAGRYADVGKRGLPNLWTFIDLTVRHLAGVDLAVGVVPFVGALVAAVAFARSGFPRDRLPFATVAVAVTTLLLLEVAFDAALYDGPSGDQPRIHERFLIYVLPFFFTALIATVRISESTVSVRVYRGAAVFAALLPLVIPFHTVVNQTIVFETFGLQPFARVANGELVALPYAPVAAVWIAATLALLYVEVRRRTRAVVVLMLIPFVLISGLLKDRIEAGSVFGRSVLPRRVDWVDAAKPKGDVVLISIRTMHTAALETAYSNLSITRIYYICGRLVGPEFGELPVTVDDSGRLRSPSGLVHASYAVAPRALGVRGRVVARNDKGRQVLVLPQGGGLSVAPGRRAALNCKSRQSRS
jgi:hypothetical protein